MKKAILSVFAVPFILAPAVMLAQSGMKPTGATYITDEEVKQVNALPGIDRTIRVVDIGPENFAVGIIHRGATGAAARAARRRRRGGRTGARGAARRRRGGADAARRRRPNRAASSRRRRRPAARRARIAHDQQTEGYLIVSGSGTLVTGGKIVNGRKSPAESEVTKILNGPSCSGIDRRRRRRQARSSRPATSSSSRPACRTAGRTSRSTSTI